MSNNIFRQQARTLSMICQFTFQIAKASVKLELKIIVVSIFSKKNLFSVNPTGYNRSLSYKVTEVELMAHHFINIAAYFTES